MTESLTLNPVASRIRHIMSMAPKEPALLYDDVWFTWQQELDLSAVIELQLKEQRIDRGSPVALIVRNRPSGVAALLGLLINGRRPVLISPIQPPRAIADAVSQLSIEAVFADTEDWTPELQQEVALSGSAGWAIDQFGGELTSTLRAVRNVSQSATGFVVSENTAIVVSTSGTTGPPKPIEVSWEDLRLDTSKDPRPPASVDTRPPVIQSLSTATITGLNGILRPVVASRSIALMERVDIVQWSALVKQFELKRTGLPPAAMRSLIDSDVPRDSFKSMEAWITGSARVDPDLQLEFEETFGVPVLVLYGATEFGGAIAAWTLEDHREWMSTKRGSVGRAHDDVELRTVDPETGSPLEPGQTGLLEAFIASRRDEGWFRTNDLAHIDEDGFIFIEGRFDDVIIRGGFKVSLGELERLFESHPDVTLAAAVGLPDTRLGEVPGVGARVREGARVTGSELLAWARARTAPYKIPTVLEIVDDFVYGPSYKVDRVALRDHLLNVESERDDAPESKRR
jgi:long-chain acyl-CoA synthetase